MELDQARAEQVTARLQVDRARQAEVAHGVDGTRVGVARVGDGLDGRGELGLGWLLAEGVAPLVRVRRRLHHPCRLKVGHVRRLVGAYVVQHHHQYVLTVGC